ncbi:hypothetical protein WJX73_009761 [Symbiochloris irregularis]|uniref:Inositol-1-monophosphatase n=1 Tax=Symbiochloris irregularis TaxID=706552 RepID=A0AAW1PKP0_9CHLO
MAQAHSFSSADLDHITAAAVVAAEKAGAVIKKAFHLPKSVIHKGKVDLVTETDKECEALIFGLLKEQYPDHKYIGEEDTAAQGSAPQLTSAPTWMIDPIDGTTNFVHRFPFVCVSIALVANFQPVVAVVFNPIMEELFTAQRGQGAKLNGQPIRVSDCNDLSSALTATELGTARDSKTFAAVTHRLAVAAEATQSIRCLGSCALDMCCVACGRLDAMYEVGFGGCWDCAAGALIVEEAGGQLLDPSGAPFELMSRRVLATNAHLGAAAAQVLAACPEGPLEPGPPKK